MEQYRLTLKRSPQVFTRKFTAHALAAAGRVNCAAFDALGRLFIGTDKGLLFLDGSVFVRVSGIDKNVSSVCLLPGGALAAASFNSVYVYSGNTLRLLQAFELPVLQLARGGENAYALTAETLYKFNGESFKWEQDVDFATAACMAPTAGKEVFVSCEQAFLRLMAKRTRFSAMIPSMTHAPQIRINCMAADALGGVWVGAENGVWVFDGRSEWLPPQELPQFPWCNITAIALGKTKTYIGTDCGLYIVSGEHTRFYGAGRYLTGSRVYAVLPKEDDSEVVVCAENGVSILRFQDMSLGEKAAYYENLLPYFTREGYLNKREATVNGDLSTGHVTVSDNDGLHTADLVAYQSMKYALTGERQALETARGGMKALLKLQCITGIPGFPARAYRRPGEDRFGNGDPEWHLTQDETGPVEWKGETSSDELVGHYFAGCWYFDLCADAAEKAELAEAYRAITDHILSHGYTLCDADGLPTSWAHFGPDELNNDDAWCWEKGVNSLELITFLRITYHLTGDNRYLELQRELITRSHYALNVLVYKKDDAHSSVIDDRLTMYTLTHLLRLETDETLLRYVRLGLRRHYEYIREDHMPYFAFVFAFANGGHAELDEAVRVLEEYPMDLRYYKMTQLGRPDIALEPRVSQFGESPHLKHPLPASERVTGELHSTARKLATQSETAVCSPGSWLLAYWFGRYLQLFDE